MRNAAECRCGHYPWPRGSARKQKWLQIRLLVKRFMFGSQMAKRVESEAGFHIPIAWRF